MGTDLTVRKSFLTLSQNLSRFNFDLKLLRKQFLVLPLLERVIGTLPRDHEFKFSLAVSDPRVTCLADIFPPGPKRFCHLEAAAASWKTRNKCYYQLASYTSNPAVLNSFPNSKAETSFPRLKRRREVRSRGQKESFSSANYLSPLWGRPSLRICFFEQNTFLFLCDKRCLGAMNNIIGIGASRSLAESNPL